MKHVRNFIFLLKLKKKQSTADFLLRKTRLGVAVNQINGTHEISNGTYPIGTPLNDGKT